MSDQEAPTPEEMADLQKVSEAGAKAASEGGDHKDVAKAMRQEADKVKLDISDEDLNKIATIFSSKVIADLETRGAFDPPPEPVHPATPAQAPPAPGEGDTAQQEPAQPPRKPTFADKYIS